MNSVIPGVERASTATAVAMERLADPRVQKRLAGIGVAVVDNQGGFRAFLDVLGDIAPALERLSEAQRSAFLLKTFGREALGGVNAMLTQVTDGIRTNTGETLRGARAIAFLRKQFDEAGGTAASFREKLLDTFAGQKQLLRGSLETLAIVLGEPFAQVLKPVVAAVVESLNLFLRFVRAVPAPVKRAFAGFVVAAGAAVALIGAVVTAKASIALLMIGLKALGISIGGVLTVALPAIPVVAVLAAVVAGFAIAFKRNLGGIGDFCFAHRRTRSSLLRRHQAALRAGWLLGFSDGHGRAVQISATNPSRAPGGIDRQTIDAVPAIATRRAGPVYVQATNIGAGTSSVVPFEQRELRRERMLEAARAHAHRIEDLCLHIVRKRELGRVRRGRSCA